MYIQNIYLHILAKTIDLVRAATKGEYDHIGMILRLKGGKVGVLEALGSGVQVFLWRNFLKYKWYQQYPKVAMRSLIIPDINLRKIITKQLSEFVKTVVNRQYGWSPIQLMRKTSNVSLYDDKRTFFCSELIAKALKEVSLLRKDYASSQYFPSHFQETKHLKLLKGCSFSSEMIVEWNHNNGDNIDRQYSTHLNDMQQCIDHKTIKPKKIKNKNNNKHHKKHEKHEKHEMNCFGEIRKRKSSHPKEKKYTPPKDLQYVIPLSDPKPHKIRLKSPPPDRSFNFDNI